MADASVSRSMFRRAWSMARRVRADWILAAVVAVLLAGRALYEELGWKRDARVRTLVQQADAALGRTPPDLHRAQRLLTEATRVRENDADLLRKLGEVDIRLRETELALFAFERALQLEPRDVHTRMKYGDLLLAASYYPRAAQVYRDGLSLSRDDPDLLESLARVHVHAGNLNQALPLLKKLLRLDRLRPSANLMLAEVYMSSGDKDVWNTAVSHFAIAIRQLERSDAPEDKRALARANSEMGSVLARMDHKETEAEKVLRNAVTLEPNSITYRLNLADFLRRWKRHADALEELGRAARKEPYNTDVAAHLIRVYLDRDEPGDVQRARDVADRFLVRSPRVQQQLSTLIENLLKKKP